jgi:serine/threonine protein phosphatase PrpC
MRILLYPPLAIHERGQRQANQDCIYPRLKARADRKSASRLFLVCDGVGGAARGADASRIVCATIAKHLKDRDSITDKDIEMAVSAAEQALDRFVRKHADAEGMATTLAMLFLQDGGATVAHIGDSRVYHFRQGEVKFKTSDHSLINELLASKVITAEQVASHPGRHVISRAVMSRRKPAEPEIAHLRDVQAGDYFFLCSDGVVESFSDADLAGLMGRDDLSNDEKMANIQATCRASSRDNSSAWLLQVSSISPAKTEAGSENQKKDGWWARLVAAVSKIMPLSMADNKRQA